MKENKLNGESLDISVENLKKLREILPEELKNIFPEIDTEGKIDFEKLKLILGDEIEESNERYNFTWNGKLKALHESQKPSTGTLRPCKEESKNWDNTENLYIEGDNLEVLKLLQKTYHNKIKMIYIDPPYNTGNEFVYRDNYKDNLKNYLELTNQIDEEGNRISTNPESNGRYHTDWLNMIYPRLRLARNLLRDDGVIFISIDDHEVHNLRKICDEIFGESNLLGQFVVNSTPNARDYGHIGKMHDYVLFYAKNFTLAQTNLLPEVGKKFKYSDSRGDFNIHPLYNSNESFTNLNRPNLFYPFYIYLDHKIDEDFYKIGLEKRSNSLEIFPPKSVKNRVQFVWRWGKEKAKKNLNSEIIGYMTSSGEYRIVQKMRHSKKLIRSILSNSSYANRRGTAEVEELFNKKIFNFPKPISLLKDFLKIATNRNDIILDFFSGSGTTAHATMQLNAEDGGNRKYIMVQLPEPTKENSEAFKFGYKNLCEIGKERIRRAGEKIKEENENTENLDIGFKVFKLDSSNIKPWNPDFKDIEKQLKAFEDNIVEGRNELDIVYEIMIKYGINLTYKVEEHEVLGKKIYSIGMGMLLICLEKNITKEIADEIIKLKNKLNPETMKVVFRDNGFKSDSDKINIKETLKNDNIDEFVSI